MEIRKEILDILTKDAKIANRHIAAMLGIEEAKVAEEIKAMEDEGIILRYSAVLNTEVMGDLAPAEAFIELKVSRSGILDITISARGSISSPRLRLYT